jgi:hypothetical protein
MKKTRGFVGFPLVLTILALAAFGVAISLWIPISWENNPPKCCDVPNEGTNYGFPLVIKGTSCCGITGTQLEFRSYENTAYNFIMYAAVLILIVLISRALRGKRSIGPTTHYKD